MVSAREVPHETPPRRTVLAGLTLLLGLVASVAAGVPVVGYLLGALRKPRTVWVALGPVNTFPRDETRLHTFDNPLRLPWDGTAAHTGVYVRYLGANQRHEHQFRVFSINCTHLGCPVSWFPQSGLFMCPCHGGVYYENGDRASGPPPRGLFHCVWRVRGGLLEIRAPHFPTLHDTLEQSAMSDPSNKAGDRA
jgi:Rieske Fe-S protein